MSSQPAAAVAAQAIAGKVAMAASGWDWGINLCEGKASVYRY
jgi:hypothetical protein